MIRFGSLFFLVLFVLIVIFTPKKSYSNEYVDIRKVDMSRANDSIIFRSHNYIEDIYKFSDMYELQPWMVLGIIINESNSTNIISKTGTDYGLGQIRCFDSSLRKGFSWLNFLKKNVGISSCEDLLIPEINIKSICVILNYIKTNYKKKHDRHLVTYYHKGVKWKNYDVGYYSRIFIYGKISLSKYPLRKIKWCS